MSQCRFSRISNGNYTRYLFHLQEDLNNQNDEQHEINDDEIDFTPPSNGNHNLNNNATAQNLPAHSYFLGWERNLPVQQRLQDRHSTIVITLALKLLCQALVRILPQVVDQHLPNQVKRKIMDGGAASKRRQFFISLQNGESAFKYANYHARLLEYLLQLDVEDPNERPFLHDDIQLAEFQDAREHALKQF